MNFREIEATRRRRAPGLAGEYDYAGAVNDVLGPVAGTPVPGLALGAYEAGRDAARAELQGAPDMAFSLDETETPPVTAPAPGLAPANEVFASPPPVAAPITPPGAPAAPVSSPPLASAPATPQVPGGTTPQAPPPEAAPGTAPTMATQQEIFGTQPPRPTQPTPGNDSDHGREDALSLAAPGLAGQPMAKDSRRSDKMLGRSAPGLDGYGMTQAEREGLQEARQGDRRMRIAQGVLSGVGGLLGAIGVGTNNAALAGIGAGTRLAGGVIPAGRRAEEVLADYDRRVRGVQAQTEADQRAQQLGIEGERVGVQRTTADANMVRAQGQAQLDAANAATAEFERAAADGNAAGMRAAIRARIAAMPDDARKAVLARSYASGTAIDRTMDLASLRDMLADVEGVDSAGMQIERSRGRGGGGGGGGLVYVEGQGYDTQAPTGGGSRAPSGPTFSDPFAEAPAPGEAPPAVAPQAAPARPSARRRREPQPGAPAAPGAAPPAEAGPTPQPIGTSLNDDMNRYRRALQRLNIDPDSGPGKDEIETFASRYINGTAGGRSTALAQLQARIGEASNAESQGLPPGVTAQQWQRANSSEFRSAMQQRARIARLVPNMRREMTQHPEEFALAVRYAGQNVPLPPNANRIAQRISATLIPQLKEMSGATVTDSELARTLQAFGLGSWSSAAGNPGGYIRSLEQALAELASYTNGMVSTGIGARAAAPFYSRMLGGDQAEWERRLGGGGGQ